MEACQIVEIHNSNSNLDTKHDTTVALVEEMIVISTGCAL